MANRFDGDLGRAPSPAVQQAPVTSALRRISWGAVIAGTAIALAVFILLQMLGLGLGLKTGEDVSAGEIDVGGWGVDAIWWGASFVLATLAGGWVSARLAGMPLRVASILHGLVTWAATTLVVLYLMTTTVGSLLGGALQVLQTSLSAATEATEAVTTTTGEVAEVAAAAAGAVLPDISGGTLQQILQEARSLISTSEGGSQAAGDSLIPALTRVLTGSETASTAEDPGAAADDRGTITDLLVQFAGLSEQQAEQQLQEWESAYQQALAEAEQTAVQTAEATAEAISQAAIWTFIALLLAAIAAGLGGWLGMPREEVVVTTTTTTRY